MVVDTRAIASQAIGIVVERWRSATRRGDLDGLAKIWDTDYASLTYLPTDTDALMTSWAEIEACLKEVFASRRASDLTLRDLIVDIFDENVAFATVVYDLTYHSPVSPDAVKRYWEGRATFHFHRRSSQSPWLIIHFEDSTLMNRMLKLMHHYHQSLAGEVGEALKQGDTATALERLDVLEAEPSLETLAAVGEKLR